jgi:hypothetical protein
LSVEKQGEVRGYHRELRRYQEKTEDACRLRRLKKENQANELVPVWHPGQPDRAKVVRPRCKSAAEAEDKPASDRQGAARQGNQAEQGEQHRRPLRKVHGRRSRSVIASQLDDQARRQLPGEVAQNRRRRRVTSKDLRLSSSVRRRLWERVKTAHLAEVRRLDYVNRSRRRRVEEMRMNRAPNEKGCRVLRNRRRNGTSSRSNSSKEVARLRELSATKGSGSRKVDREDNQKKRHRRDHNYFGAINTSGSGT